MAEQKLAQILTKVAQKLDTLDFSKKWSFENSSKSYPIFFALL